MKRVHREITIAAPPAAVFALLADVANYKLFFVGLTRWEPITPEPFGVGSRIKVLQRAGSIAVGGVVRVTAVETDRFLAWESESGLRQRGQWSLEAVGGGTRLTLQLEAHLSGGLAGKIAEYLSAKTFSRYMEATLLAVKRIVEHEIFRDAIGGAGE